MSSKEAFEKNVGDGFSLAKKADGSYLSITTELAWDSWKAATERAAKIVSDEGLVIHSAGLAVVVAKIREGSE